MTRRRRVGTVESRHLPSNKETDMNSHKPAKRLSAAAALPLAIIIEAGAIAVNVGGLVTATLAYLVCFGVCHQIRLARWRHRTA
jgi:hypothetical protein